MIDPAELWRALGYPLARLTLFISIGLLIGNLIEALNWTRSMARVAAPLIRLGHMRDISGASFSMAFFSGVTANTMLAEAYRQGRLNRRELIFSNLFNSLPTYFLHLPTMFFIIAPILKGVALVYLGLTVSSAVLRTLFVLVLARFTLTPQEDSCVTCELPEAVPGWGVVLSRTWKRFRLRIRKILMFTIPIYILFFWASRAGVFQAVEGFLADHVGLLAWLPTEALSIVVFQLGAEFSAGVAAAGAMLDGAVLTGKEVVLALLIGNILSSPVRAFRHQFPYYAGIFSPRMAGVLIVFNQSLRVGSLILVGAVYALVA
jgi:hypothetical protein